MFSATTSLSISATKKPSLRVIIVLEERCCRGWSDIDVIHMCVEDGQYRPVLGSSIQKAPITQCRAGHPFSEPQGGKYEKAQGGDADNIRWFTRRHGVTCDAPGGPMILISRGP